MPNSELENIDSILEMAENLKTTTVIKKIFLAFCKKTANLLNPYEQQDYANVLSSEISKHGFPYTKRGFDLYNASIESALKDVTIKFLIEYARKLKDFQMASQEVSAMPIGQTLIVPISTIDERNPK